MAWPKGPRPGRFDFTVMIEENITLFMWSVYIKIMCNVGLLVFFRHSASKKKLFGVLRVSFALLCFKLYYAID